MDDSNLIVVIFATSSGSVVLIEDFCIYTYLLCSHDIAYSLYLCKFSS